MVEDMLDTDSEFIEENKADENTGFHGDLPPMIDEGRRSNVMKEHATRHSSKPEPFSQVERRVSSADTTEKDHGLHILREKIEKDMVDKTRKATM